MRTKGIALRGTTSLHPMGALMLEHQLHCNGCSRAVLVSCDFFSNQTGRLQLV